MSMSMVYIPLEKRAIWSSRKKLFSLLLVEKMVSVVFDVIIFTKEFFCICFLYDHQVKHSRYVWQIAQFSHLYWSWRKPKEKPLNLVELNVPNLFRYFQITHREHRKQDFPPPPLPEFSPMGMRADSSGSGAVGSHSEPVLIFPSFRSGCGASERGLVCVWDVGIWEKLILRTHRNMGWGHGWETSLRSCALHA